MKLVMYRQHLIPYLLTLCTVFFHEVSLKSQSVAIPSGSYLINMGIEPQTVGNALKPYGLVYDLTHNYSVPVIWSINPAKGKDGTDFSYNGVNYKGGSFIVPAQYRTPQVDARITYWQGLGVVGAFTTSETTVPVYTTLYTAPRWTMDKQNGDIVLSYFTNAGIPPSAFGGLNPAGWKNPADLECCDDTFIMPHADPEWATHSNLLTWNAECRGGIWAACHAVSALENMINPANRNEQTNFLTKKDPNWTGTSPPYAESNSLILWGDHKNGSHPYTYRLHNDPIAQFMGILDDAVDNGSERIFIPRQGTVANPSTYSPAAVARWNPSAKVIVYDESQQNVTNPDLTTFKNVAAIIVYGRAFEDAQRGLVIYEAGHSHEGTSPQDIAAQRAMFNFSLLAANDKVVAIPDLTMLPDSIISGIPSEFHFTLPPPADVNHYNISWTSSCGGSFAPNATQQTVYFTAPNVHNTEPCVITVTVTDSCGRRFFNSRQIQIKGIGSWQLSKVSTKVPNHFTTVGEQIPYDIRLSNTGYVDVTSVLLTDPQADAMPVRLADVSGNNDLVLEPGEVWKYTATHTVVQADLDAGFYENTATATGHPVTGSLNPASDTETVPALQQPAIQITKTITQFSQYALNDKIKYSLKVENTGNVTLLQVLVSDPNMDAIPGLVYLSGDLNYNSRLEPDEIWVYEAYHTATVQNMQAGTFTNTASVSAVTGTGLPVNDASSATATAITADVAVMKSSSSPTVIAGNSLTYTIKVVNNGPFSAGNVIVSDLLPSAVEFISAVPDRGNWNNNQWNIGTLQTNMTAILQMTVRVKSQIANGISFTNTCQVQSATFDPLLTNNTSSVSTNVITRADLQITKSDLVDPVKAGQRIRYQISVYNAGPSDARLVSITDLVPTGINSAVFSTNGGQTWNNWPTLYQNNDLAAGQTFSILIEGNTAPSLPHRDILFNTAQTYSSTIDPDLANNQDTAQTTILREADLEVTKTHIDPLQLPSIVPVSPSKAISGTLIYYQVIARNYGPGYAQNTVLTDIVPSGISNAQYSLDYGTSWSNWTGSISLNDFYGSSFFLIRGKIAADKTGVVINTAVISSDTPDPFLPNNSDTVRTDLLQLADLSVVKEELIIPLRENGPISYQITVNNDGPSDASNVIVRDIILPTLITNPEYSLNQGLLWQAWGDSLDIGSLAEHHQFSFLLRGTLTNASPLPNINPIPNTVSVRSRTTADPNLTNNQYTIETPLDAEADLSITKIGPVSVYAGETVDYSLIIKNHSAVFTSANILVFDEIEDDDILNTKYSLDNGMTWVPWMDQIGIPSLGPQDSIKVLITGKVKSSLRGSIYNIANVLSLGTPDPNPSNNFSSVTTQILVRADLRITKVQISPQLLPLDYDNLPADISSLAIVPPAAIPGTTVYYALQYMNHGSSDAELIIINDLIPANLTQVQYAPCRSSFRPWTGAFTVGNVEAGKGCVVILKGVIHPSATGILTNTATVDAPDIPDPDPDNDTSTFNTILTPEANLSILKQVNQASVKAGDTCTFTLLVKNHGPSTAQLAAVTDLLPPGLNLIDAMPTKGAWNSPTWQIGTLVPDEIQSITLRAYTSLLPDDYVLTNTGIVGSATPDPDVSNNQSSALVTIQAHPALLLRKEIIGTYQYNQPGQTIQYAYHITNNGDVDLTTPATILDDVIGTIHSCGSWPLKHGQTTTCFASYTVDQDDLNRGFVTNHATASTYYLDVPVFSNMDEATAYAIQQPKIHIDKIPASINGVPYPAKYNAAGDLISYRFLVTNTGNLTLYNLQVSDLKIPGSPQYLSGDAGNDRIMQPNETWEFTGLCQVSQQDVDRGSFTNIATATALADLNGDGTGEGLVQDKDTSVIFNDFSPKVVVSKFRDKINNDPQKTKYSLPGDKIMYTLRMKNTGNITLYLPVMTDPLADYPPIYMGGDSDMDGRLDVAEEWTYRAQCTVTQAMIDKGSLINIAQGTARWDGDMNGSWESMVSDTGSTNTKALQLPHLTVRKIAVSVNGSGQSIAYSRTGDIISYILTMTNDGNITLFQPQMQDQLATTGPSYISGDNSGIGILNPGETWTYTATHRISQIEAGLMSFTNVGIGVADADLDGDGNGDDLITASDQATVPRIAAETGGYVWHDLNGNGQQDVGEPPMQNIQVSLFKSNGVYIATTTTDAGGHYSFQSILPGDYYCKYIAPTAFLATYAHKGNEATDSDMDGSFGPWTSSLITYNAINAQEHFDAGFFLCIPVGDLVWYDINKNDVWDSNENGINGLTVRIWKNEQNFWLLWAQTKTGQKPGSPSDDGFFSFCVPPGEYYLDITMPPIGLVKVRANVGTNEEIDSDFPLSGNPLKSLSFTVRSGETRMDFGAGFYPMSSMGNTVWLDKNINGVQDQGEPKIAGVRIEAIETVSGNKVAEAITDAGGNYTLDYMEKTSYYLRFSPPLGYSATYAHRGNDDIDSDVDHSFGTNTTRAIPLSPGQALDNIDMGLVQSPLAIQWLDISGQVKDGRHLISWRTGKEFNTDYYLIERKMNDQETIEVMPDTIQANGTTSEVSEYKCIFDDIARNTEYLYRVSETEFDGSRSWSAWVRLKSDQQEESRVFPNPSNGLSQVFLSLTNESEVDISVWQDQRKLASLLSATLTDEGSYAYPIDLRGFPNGLYNIQVKIGDTTHAHLLLKIE